MSTNALPTSSTATHRLLLAHEIALNCWVRDFDVLHAWVVGRREMYAFPMLSAIAQRDWADEARMRRQWVLPREEIGDVGSCPFPRAGGLRLSARCEQRRAELHSDRDAETHARARDGVQRVAAIDRYGPPGACATGRVGGFDAIAAIRDRDT